jgi:hypothetical protein
MARRKTASPTLPPATARQCWATFLKWSLGVPLICAGGLGIIGGALWLAGGQELMWRTVSDMGTALFYIAGILLMYPLLMVMWVADLRSGLAAARDWAALSPEAQAKALAAVPAPRRRKRR